MCVCCGEAQGEWGLGILLSGCCYYVGSLRGLKPQHIELHDSVP